MGSPVDVCSVPAVVPDETAFAHWAVSAYGSCGSRWIGRTADSVPLASASTSWPAFTFTVFLPLTLTVPSKTLIRFVLLARTSSSNWVPRTSALTECPPTLKLAPLARCCTLISVRPTFWTTSAVCSWPFFWSCTLVICTVVSGDMRT